MFKLKGKKVIVTGAGSGIGKAIAKRFAEEDCLIAICDINLEAVNLVAKEIEIIGAKAIPYKVDVSSFEEVTTTVNKIAETLGGIEILVNNAGITKDSLLLRMNEQDFDKVIAVNLKGTFNFTKASVKFMIKEGWGRIINISSIIGEMGNAGQANYAAAKAGIIGFTKSIAKELASRNITVNAIAPGFIKTPMTENLPENIKENYRKLIPLGREGLPEDVANLCLFLASDEASYITGQVIRVDGGMLM
ncbi:MAG: 3-oxoacyl-[acyl-carrier-protein] reductase [candidate division WOR-3 bacterium]